MDIDGEEIPGAPDVPQFAVKNRLKKAGKLSVITSTPRCTLAQSQLSSSGNLFKLHQFLLIAFLNYNNRTMIIIDKSKYQ